MVKERLFNGNGTTFRPTEDEALERLAQLFQLREEGFNVDILVDLATKDLIKQSQDEGKKTD